MESRITLGSLARMERESWMSVLQT